MLQTVLLTPHLHCGIADVLSEGDGKTLRILLDIATDAIAATGTAPMEPCRESKTMVGTQIQPIALRMANRIKETEDRFATETRAIGSLLLLTAQRSGITCSHKESWRG